MENLPALRTGKARAEFGHVTPVDETAIPFAIIESLQPGPTLLITAGVHGSEFCSVEAAVRTMRIKPGRSKETLVILPILQRVEAAGEASVDGTLGAVRAKRVRV